MTNQINPKFLKELGEGAKKKADEAQSHSNENRILIYAILVVVAITIVTLIMQYFTATQAAFFNLGNQVTAQNAKIDTLIQLQQNINYRSVQISPTVRDLKPTTPSQEVQ